MPSLRRRTRFNRKQQWIISRNSNSSNYEPNTRRSKKIRNLVNKRGIAHVKNVLLELSSSEYCEDCRYHPCRITKIEADWKYHSVDIEVVSLVNGKGSSCSWEHCGIVMLSEDEAQKRTSFIIDNGMLPYEYRDFPKEKFEPDMIRYSRYLDKVWGFSENQDTTSITDKGILWFNTHFNIDLNSLSEMEPNEANEYADKMRKVL